MKKQLTGLLGLILALGIILTGCSSSSAGGSEPSSTGSVAGQNTESPSGNEENSIPGNDTAELIVRFGDEGEPFTMVLEDNSKMRETVPMIEAVDGVAEVNAPYQVAEALGTVQHILRIVSAAVIILLLVVSLLIISNTVKLAMYDRRDEIAIMKMVGATNGFIRFPFVIEGFLLGIFGAAVAFFLEWGLYNGMVNWIGTVDSLNLLDFVPFTDLLWPMVATFGAAGLFVGIFGSFASIRKFLDV